MESAGRKLRVIEAGQCALLGNMNSTALQAGSPNQNARAGEISRAVASALPSCRLIGLAQTSSWEMVFLDKEWKPQCRRMQDQVRKRHIVVLFVFPRFLHKLNILKLIGHYFSGELFIHIHCLFIYPVQYIWLF